MQINYAKKQVSCKLVYYGPGMSGKTTNLEVIHQKVPTQNKGEMTSIATEGDRTLFFDFLPLDLGEVRGMTTKFQLYTVPGQVYYASTRKLVLQGADGVIFVADSQSDKIEANKESFKDLSDNLNDYGLDIKELPLVIQWNKRDLPSALPIDELEKSINTVNAATTTAVAATGEGVLNTLKLAASLILDRLNAKASGAEVRPKVVEKKPPEPEQYVAKVNKDGISRSYFNQYCQVQYRLGVKSGEVEEFKRFTPDEKKKLLESLINYVLLLQDAKKRGIQAPREAIDSQITAFTKKFDSQEKLDEYLKTRQLTLDNLRNEATKNIIIGKIITVVIPDLNGRMVITKTEVQEFYNKHQKRFGGKPLEQVHGKVKAAVKSGRKRSLLEELYKKLRKEASIQVFHDKL